MAPEKMQHILSSNGLSVTRPRLLIIDSLYAHGPLSSVELHKQLTNKVDRATVYRTLKSLVRVGLIQQVAIGWKYKFKLGDAFKGHHHHAVCVRCKGVTEFRETPDLELAIGGVAKKHGFKVADHRFELEIICPKCQ